MILNLLKQQQKNSINLTKSLNYFKLYYSKSNTQCSTCSNTVFPSQHSNPISQKPMSLSLDKNINSKSNISTTPTTLPTTTATTTSTNIDKPIVSFYKRNLPSHLVEFSSDEGKKIFKGALESGMMEGYFSLAEQFVSQSDPAYCGLASLAMVLNSLKIDPKRLWKGPWRWFAEDMLDCCIPIDSVKKRGITFTEFSCLSRCNGANIRSIRADEHSDINEFRESIKEACSKQGTHLVMSYSRKVLGQTGSGHYSPIGGYHPELDMALVLDVARFKYSPHWCSVQVLWDSMTALDKDTQRPRGYYLLSSDPSYTPSFCRIKNTLSWSSVADKFLNSELPLLMERLNPKSYDQVIEILFQNLPSETPYVLCAYSHELHKKLSLIENNNEILSQHQHPHSPSLQLNYSEFFKELSNSSSFEIIKNMIFNSRITNWKVSHQHDLNTPKEICHDYPIHLATLMFLALPSHLFNKLSNSIRENLSIIRNLDNLNIQVINEIMKIRDEMFKVSQSSCECSPEQQKGCK